MKRNRFLFRLSLIANIVLVVWALSQRAQIQKMLRDDKESDEALDRVINGMNRNMQMVKDQVMRTIASTDQLDAFLEERGIYVD